MVLSIKTFQRVAKTFIWPKIKKWHDTKEYKKLCEKVRSSVEEKMREEWMKASATSHFLARLA